MKNWRINWVAAAAARYKSQLSPQYCFKGEVAINFIRAAQSSRGRRAAPATPRRLRQLRNTTPRCRAASRPHCLRNFPPVPALQLMLMWICFVISEEIEIFLMDNYVIVKYGVITTCAELSNAAVPSAGGSKSMGRDTFSLWY